MSIIKKSITDTFVYGIGMILSRFSSLVLLPFLTHKFSPEQYAMIAIVFIIIPFTRFLVPLEISQAVMIFFVDAKTVKERKLVFSTGFWFTCLSVIIFALIGFIIRIYSKDLGLKDISSFSYQVMWVLLTALLFDSLTYFCLNMIRWIGNRKYYNFVYIFISWGNVFFILLFIDLFSMGLKGVFLGWFVSWGLGFSLVFFNIRAHLKLCFSLNYLIKMLKFSFPLLLNNIPSTINKMVDRYLVLFFIGLYTVGLYSAALSSVSVAYLLPFVMQTAIWPLVYKHCSSERKEGAKQDIAELFFFGLKALGVFAIIMILVSKLLLTLLLSPQYAHSFQVQASAPIFIVSYLVMAFQNFFPGMAITRKNQYTLICSLSALTSNVIFGVVLIKTIGIIGVALSVLFSNLIQVCLYAAYSQKLYRIPLSLSRVSLRVVFIFILMACAFWLNLELHAFTFQSFIIRGGCIIIIGIGLLLYYVDHVRIKKAFAKVGG